MSTSACPILMHILVNSNWQSCLWQSCLMQDEPGARVCFSYKMSLEEPFGMPGIDHKNAVRGTIEPGGNTGIFGGQRWVGIQGPRSRGGLRVGEPDAASGTLSGFEAERPWTGAAIRFQDDGTKPSAIDAAAENVRTRRRGEAETVSTAPFPAAVPAGGY